MARKLIAVTDDAALQPTISATLGFRFLVGLVRDHLGADAVTLLCEPQPIQNEGRRQWMTEAPLAAPAIRLGDAPPAVAAKARSQLATIRGAAAMAYRRLSSATDERTRQTGGVLVRAFEIPDDDKDVWIVGGRPVLVGWGHINVNAKPLDTEELATRYQRALEPPPVAPTPLPVGPIPTPAAPDDRLRRWLPWLLLLLALLVAGYLVRQCAVFLPFLPTGWQNCPAPPPAPPGPQPSACEREGCETGRLQVTLLWQTQDDLDLYVDCPGDTLFFDHRTGACGDGKLDLDAQADRDMPEPVENVRWQAPPPTGRYRVRVQFSRVKQAGDGPIGYEVQVRLNDELRVCRGQVDRPTGDTAVVTTAITFDLPGHLPACDRR